MEIASKILSSMPSVLNDLEKARYIYLELCKYVTFTTKLDNCDDSTLTELLNTNVDISNF